MSKESEVKTNQESRLNNSLKPLYTAEMCERVFRKNSDTETRNRLRRLFKEIEDSIKPSYTAEMFKKIF